MFSAAVVFLAVVFPDEQPKEKPDIACELSGMYTGNAINPTFTLKIEGPKTNRWSYSMRDDMFGVGARAESYTGTYEIDGDLAVFTGEQGGKEPKPLK
ncbi:MAG: hypothetical protein FJ304_18590, partial [Planctomycetes bacterium]|nr:hypothetical protein [Planctomycetota bacterium]